MFKKLLVLVLSAFLTTGLVFAEETEDKKENIHKTTCEKITDKRACCNNTENHKNVEGFDHGQCFKDLEIKVKELHPLQRPYGEIKEASNQSTYRATFPGKCPLGTTSDGTKDFLKVSGCIGDFCAEDKKTQAECEQAGAFYIQNLGRRASTDVTAYERAHEDHYSMIVAYQRCVEDKDAYSCENQLTPIKGKAAAIEKTLETQEVLDFIQAMNILSGKADRRARAQAAAALQSQTGFFDLNNISVGNEKYLRVGGAEENENNVLARVINLMAKLFGTVAVFMFVVGAFFMIFSQGAEDQLNKGKTIVLYTIIGLLIGFTSYIIVQFVINILFQT